MEQLLIFQERAQLKPHALGAGVCRAGPVCARLREPCGLETRRALNAAQRFAVKTLDPWEKLSNFLA